MRGEIIIKDIRITARVTEKQRRRIAANAKRCGLSQSEYIKQRALGYEPRAAAPDAYFALCERIDALAELAGTPEAEQRAMELLKSMDKELIIPRKEGVAPWQSQASGQLGQS